MNVVILTGNLARDPETRVTPKGTAVIEATLCVSEKWTDDAGQQREKTVFAGLVFYGARGEAFARHHRKGSRAFIRGKLIQETWDDKATGRKREKTKVQVDDWEFAGAKPAEGAAPAPPRRFNDRSPTAPTSSEWPDGPISQPGDDSNDLVPF